jgi:hypothetical protein
VSGINKQTDIRITRGEVSDFYGVCTPLMVVLKNTDCFGFRVSSSSFLANAQVVHLVGRGELGHGLGALRHGVLGQLTGEEQSHGSLDLSGGEGGLLAVAGQAGSFQSQALEDVVDERVQDGHASLGDAGVGVHLLQHLVDVRSVGFDLLGLSAGGSLLGGLRSLLADSRGLCHFGCWSCFFRSKI